MNVTPGNARGTTSRRGHASAPVPPDTVVAEVDGKKYTAAEMDKMIDMLPAQYQQAARSRPQMLSQVFLMQRLAEDAEKAGLDQRQSLQGPTGNARMQVLSTAELSDVNNTMGYRGRAAEVLQRQSRQIQGSQSPGHLHRVQSHARKACPRMARSCSPKPRRRPRSRIWRSRSRAAPILASWRAKIPTIRPPPPRMATSA